MQINVSFHRLFFLKTKSRRKQSGMNVGESGADTDTSMDVSDAYVDIVSDITGLKVKTIYNQSRPGFSKLTTSLVKFSEVNFSNMPIFFVEKI